MAPKKIGRPSSYSEEIADKICAEIADGKALVNICKDNDWAPCGATAFNWLRNYPAFLESYTHAREIQQELYAAEIIMIADTDRDAPRARNRMDARKWYAGKVSPKKWGDRVQVDADVKVTDGPSQNLTAFLAMVEQKASGRSN